MQATTPSQKGARRWQLVAILAVILLANVGLGFFAQQAATDTVSALVKEQLESKSTTTAESVRAWLKEKRLRAEVLASRADIRLAVLDLLNDGTSSKENLRSTLQAAVFGLGFSGFAAVKPDGSVLVGTDGNEDRRMLVGDALHGLRQALLSPSAIVPPVADPFGSGGDPRILSIASLAVDGRPAAGLVLLVDPEKEFSRLFNQNTVDTLSTTVAF